MSDEQIQLNLAPAILETYRDATRLADEARGVASAAVAKAIECGQLLIRQKETLGHGSWLDWLDANVPEISRWTARRYMALAKGAESNGAHVPHLADATSVRQAYIATGIIPTNPEKEPLPPDPNAPWVRYVRFIDGFRLWFNRRMEEDPLETWPENSRRVLKNDLRWIAELYARL